MVAVGVVVERQHQQRRGVGLEHQVVQRGQRVLAAALGDRGDGPLGRRFVVGRVAERVDAVGAVLDQREHAVEQRKRMRRKVVLGQDRRAHRRVGEAARQLLAIQFRLQLAVGGPVSERVVAGEAEQHAERARRDLRVHLDPVLEGLTRTIQLFPPEVRGARRLDHGERHRPFDLGRQPGHPLEFPYRRLGGALAGHTLRGHLEHRTAAGGHRPAEAEQFVFGGVGAGHRLAVDGAVPLGARRREAERAGLDGLLDDSGHRRDVVGGGLFVAGAALAHRVAAHRAVRDLRADIDGERPLLDGVEVLGEALPLPGDALGQRGAGNVLDAFHQLDEPLFAAGARPARSRRRSCRRPRW